MGWEIWDTATGGTVHLHSGSFRLQFSPDGRRLACNGGRRGGSAIWDAFTGQQLREFADPNGGVHLLAYDWLATTGDKTVNIWDVAAGQPMGSITLRTVSWKMFGRDDRSLAIGTQTDLQLWPLADGPA
jgi:WD40 repeat protein